VVVFALPLLASAAGPQPWKDPSPHEVRFVTVDTDVSLEVLDWGGTGRSIVLLAGSGLTAHVYDDLAPKLSDCCHVYGITRRGYGASSQPSTGYDNQRLADDVLRVLEALDIEAPVLVGHSMAGGEITTLANQHSDRLSGLVYLDALGDPRDLPASDPQWVALREKLPPPTPPAHPCVDDRTSFAAFRASLQCRDRFALPESELRNGFRTNPDGTVGPYKTPRAIHDAIGNGEIRRDYADIRVPVLALYEFPRSSLSELRSDDPQPRNDEERRAVLAFAAATRAFMDRWVANLKRGVPDAHIVNVPAGGHYLFITREADVLREVQAFVATLPKRRPAGTDGCVPFVGWRSGAGIGFFEPALRARRARRGLSGARQRA
jgi:pimeloyl-ACP methyl ester carboxylesterase